MNKKSISNIICKALPEVTAFLIYSYFFLNHALKHFQIIMRFLQSAYAMTRRLPLWILISERVNQILMTLPPHYGGCKEVPIHKALLG